MKIKIMLLLSLMLELAQLLAQLIFQLAGTLPSHGLVLGGVGFEFEFAPVNSHHPAR